MSLATQVTALAARIATEVKAKASKTYVDTALDGKAPAQVGQNTQTGTAYTLILADGGRVVEMNNAAANTITIPTNAAVAFPVGTIVEVFQLGVGQTTITAASGVTLRAPDGAKIGKQYGSASLRKRATDEWALAGATVI